VREMHPGIVVKPGDYEALAKAILYLRNNPRLGDSGRKYVENNLSIEKIGKGMIAVFNTVLKRRQGNVFWRIITFRGTLL
jgi:glycosyltransferase involved in cell wall biosynthesis